MTVSNTIRSIVVAGVIGLTSLSPKVYANEVKPVVSPSIEGNKTEQVQEEETNVVLPYDSNLFDENSVSDSVLPENPLEISLQKKMNQTLDGMINGEVPLESGDKTIKDDIANVLISKNLITEYSPEKKILDQHPKASIEIYRELSKDSSVKPLILSSKDFFNKFNYTTDNEWKELFTAVKSENLVNSYLNRNLNLGVFFSNSKLPEFTTFTDSLGNSFKESYDLSKYGVNVLVDNLVSGKVAYLNASGNVALDTSLGRLTLPDDLKVSGLELAASLNALQLFFPEASQGYNNYVVGAWLGLEGGFKTITDTVGGVKVPIQNPTNGWIRGTLDTEGTYRIEDLILKAGLKFDVGGNSMKSEPVSFGFGGNLEMAFVINPIIFGINYEGYGTNNDPYRPADHKIATSVSFLSKNYKDLISVKTSFNLNNNNFQIGLSYGVRK